MIDVTGSVARNRVAKMESQFAINQAKKDEQNMKVADKIQILNGTKKAAPTEDESLATRVKAIMELIDAEKSA